MTVLKLTKKDKVLIEKAIIRISNRDNWTQGVYARISTDAHYSVDWFSAKAKSFCVMGALRRAFYDVSPKTVEMITEAESFSWRISNAFPGGGLPVINDTKGREAVITALRSML
jgi:hypothetical protein